MKKLNLDRRLVLGILIFSLIQILIAWNRTDLPVDSSDKSEALDTFVPLGFTLVPIKIENHAEMGSLIESFAIVDLHKQGFAETIESNVRLLRSPRNPDVFAVLIEQDKAKKLISQHGATFTVALKNPDSKSSPILKTRTIIKE